MRGLLLDALDAHERAHPGVAASVREVAAHLAAAGAVRDRTTVADWLQEQAGDDSSPVERVAAGHYTVRRDGEPSAGPAVALGLTHRRALQAASLLHAGGQSSWTLWNLVDALTAADGSSPGRRRMHDVVTGLRALEPPLVVSVRVGMFALTPDGDTLAAR